MSIRSAIAAAIIVSSAGLSEALEFELAAKQLTVGEFSIEKIAIQKVGPGGFAAGQNRAEAGLRRQAGPATGSGIHAFIGGASHPRAGSIGDLELSCRQGT